MENYFILLELPFDPPENDTKKIEAAIAKKQSLWTRDLINPAKKPKASGYLAQLNNIKRVMLNPDTRKEEAEKAKKIKDDNKDKLKKQLHLFSIKGKELSDRDLKRLVTNFSAFGYTQAEIKKLFNEIKKPEEEEFKHDDILDKTNVLKIKTLMEALAIEDKTLYDFLELPQNASCIQLCSKAEAMAKKITVKGEKTGKDGTVQKLCQLCSDTIFKDAAIKRKYDNYINITKYYAVNSAVDEIARSNQKKIEPKMKEKLIDFAVSSYHISVSEASVYINNYCEYMGYALPQNKIICGLCGAENPAGAAVCSKCKKALFIICPSCGTQNSNSARVCAKCKFDLTKIDEAAELLARAKRKYIEKNLEEASRLLMQAKALWPGHPDAASLDKAIKEQRETAKNTVAEIMRNIQEKRLYTAMTKIDQAKAAGFEIDVSVKEKVTNTLADVEKKLSLMRNSSKEKAFSITMSLIDIISDSDELNRSLKQFPPDECPNISFTKTEDSVTFKWRESPSSGDISYKLVRKENTYPNDSDDGTVIYSGKELSYTDRSINKNTVYYYSVFAVRKEVSSRAARLSIPIVLVEKVKALRAVGGDGMAALSWKKVPSVTEIHIYKYCGNERPKDDSVYDSVPCTRLDGFTVKGLDNDSVYWFAVSAGYILNGKTYFSEKTYISVVPKKPAKPLENFKVRYSKEIFTASWEKSRWDIILFYAAREPEYAVGTVYNLDELLLQYKKIDISLKSMTEAEFKLNFTGECYIIPGVISASDVVLNTAAYISSVPVVSDISFDLNSSAAEMYVNFKWPKKIERSVLVYRMDGYPTDINDPLASKIECSKHQYEANAGILISNPQRGTYYAEIYTYFESGDRRIYSDGVKALLSNEPQKEVFYTIKYKKPGLFNKKSILSITIETDGSCIFPAFVLLSKYKSTPLKKGDGDIVCSVAENTEIKGSYTFNFDVAQLRKDTRLKLFFVNDKNYKAFKIACKSGSSI